MVMSCLYSPTEKKKKKKVGCTRREERKKRHHEQEKYEGTFKGWLYLGEDDNYQIEELAPGGGGGVGVGVVRRGRRKKTLLLTFLSRGI